MLDPRLSHLVAVARSGSFTAAAKLVGVTQSAVTKSIADLERQIGFTVFHRTPRGIILTESGRGFVEQASRLLDDARELLSGSARTSDPYAGPLRVGVCPASLEWHLAEPVAAMHARHGTIRYNVSSSNFESIVQQLRSGAVDVAIGFDAAFLEWPDMRRESIGALNVELFVRKNHPILSTPIIKLSDLAAYDFISPSDSRPYGEVIRRIYESQSIDWRDRLHFIDFFPIVRRLVESSNAVGVVARPYTQSSTFRNSFATLDGLDLFPPAPMCCAVRARWEPKPAVRALISTMKRLYPAP